MNGLWNSCNNKTIGNKVRFEIKKAPTYVIVFT